ncbi:MAG: multiubiquitin domain-containing protein [Pseudomonadota bacterium]
MMDEIDIETWARGNAQSPLPVANGYLVRLWDGDGFDEKRRIADATPTGAQVLEAFGRHPVNAYVLLLLDRTGLHEVTPDEVIDIGDRRAERFFAFRSDRLWLASLDDQRFPWGASSITEDLLRLIFRVPTERQIVLSREHEPDCVLEVGQSVDLDSAGVERLFTRPATWKLLVQGVTLSFSTPKIVVRDALIKAGLDPDSGWTAILKFVGLPKEPVGLGDVIDLSRKGIEKLWLRPNHVNNGEAPSGLRRDFSVREEDEAFLQERGLSWEALVDLGQRWCVLRAYPLPTGYRQSEVDIAVLIPPTYPAAALDMFYCFPHLELTNGRPIACTQSRQLIEGSSYQRWSRHRHADTAWKPNVDSLISHVALIDEAIAREVSEAA